MGNTKMCYFEGETDREPDRQALIEATHANYCALRVHEGEYMDTEGDGLFVIGALESSSLLRPVEAIAALLSWGTVTVFDADWTDFEAYEVVDGKPFGPTVYELSSGKRPGPPSCFFCEHAVRKEERSEAVEFGGPEKTSLACVHCAKEAGLCEGMSYEEATRAVGKAWFGDIPDEDAEWREFTRLWIEAAILQAKAKDLDGANHGELRKRWAQLVDEKSRRREKSRRP